MYSMNYIGKFISNFRDFYNEINAATLTGAIDVVVVEQPDASFTCSPFHVRFGKLGVLRSREKIVDIEINGDPRQIHMKLGDSGEAFFVEEVGSDGSPTDTEIPPHLACSPIPDDNCFPPSRFNLLSDLPPEQRDKILIESVLSIEREKWEQMSALPPDQREKFLIEQFSDLPEEHRAKWLQIASLTSEEREEMFKENFDTISTLQKQQMICEQYSALKSEERERLFKENFPELPADQRQKFEKALLSDWKKKEAKHDTLKNEEEIFDMDGINDDETSPAASTPKSFVAVTSTERIRKISVVKNDFRPITEDVQSSGKEKSSDESNVLIIKKSSKDENVDENKNNNSTKRKRKRKSIMKKKGSQRKTSNGSSSQTEMSENDTSVPDESLSESMLKETSPIVELEKKNASAEPVISVQEAVEKRPETDFHFFSDTEVTKNQDSRPCSPVQSDTEFEMRKITQEGEDGEEDKSHQQSWRWGELPSLPPESTHPSHRNSLSSSSAANQSNNTEAHRSMLSGMFSFMKKTSRVRHNPESEGIYLSDLNADELDPEVAALYFPSSHRGSAAVKGRKGVDEEDTESGNGPSLPQSPNSVEGAIGGPKSLDSDFEEPKHSIFDNNMDISISLCGGLDTETGPSKEAFHQNLLHYEDICSDPKLYENPNLVVKINGKFYNWATACPIVMTYAVFQRHLPQGTIENLYAQCMPLPLMHEEKKQENIGKPEGRSGYSSWFSWRRSTQPPKKSQELSQTDGISVQISEQIIDTKENTPVDDIPSREVKTEQIIETTAIEEAIEQRPKLSKNMTKTEKNHEREGEGYSGSEDSDSNQNESPQGVKIPKERRLYYESTEKYRKTLRLSSTQIASLNLKDGANEVVFSVTTAYQGTTRCKCHIYKWRWDDKIVISDIDGTITKSDVLGHILPIVGKDWAQSGVAQLFTKIKNNGYKLLYLSSRAIGQAKVTREYLKSIKQGDLSLPEGPLLLNPTSLISAFHREVIEKKPEEFKISCLSDIQALFPEGSKPFYAGYGNRINDVWAYRAVGIPTMRIFTINHRGELKHELTQTFQSSYSNMSFIVDHLFPAWREDAADEFSHFAYWRDPIPEVPPLEELYDQKLAM
ncbi:phosphatidate phosphatase LPIN3 isoform X1 [Osmia bicornis bicornis]|uniref:phosphatidate phosphatase LPIN3 isoform X1 n=1 Tax=Osmia bicornis bicornis TaxID=1437191 RepID=UPI0010F4E1CC|nr:phosphatidate phosphatase LPIN3 isoform X1 [Osmia bicornis bicornis]XP_029039676.1 phosphatidate phosphatase LPIN3 isoform X1 [Osmia bicornis bicornis]XP_029039678.1 phosphatidate phosphatase LPIN3 isoform X1 [Osmia bicornis bicornis]XP_029039679.1 phosphatidate phosphatase LPIN3 isoform X1 [Osmia bicornis bicornis]